MNAVLGCRICSERNFPGSGGWDGSEGWTVGLKGAMHC